MENNKIIYVFTNYLYSLRNIIENFDFSLKFGGEKILLQSSLKIKKVPRAISIIYNKYIFYISEKEEVNYINSKEIYKIIEKEIKINSISRSKSTKIIYNEILNNINFLLKSKYNNPTLKMRSIEYDTYYHHSLIMRSDQFIKANREIPNEIIQDLIFTAKKYETKESILDDSNRINETFNFNWSVPIILGIQDLKDLGKKYPGKRTYKFVINTEGQIKFGHDMDDILWIDDGSENGKTWVVSFTKDNLTAICSHAALNFYEPAIAAGKIVFYENEIIEIDNYSGHYMPDPIILLLTKIIFYYHKLPLRKSLNLTGKY